MRIEVKFRGLPGLAERLNRKLVRAAETSLFAADRRLSELGQENIVGQGSIVSRVWAELSESTKRQRMFRWGYYRRASGSGASRPIGIWTGKLHEYAGTKGRINKRTLTSSRSFRDAPGRDVSPPARLWSLHTGRGGSIPRRPVFDLGQTSRMKKELLDQVLQSFDTGLARQ
jgi:hypothetical protein